jgi:hypothetical protein
VVQVDNGSAVVVVMVVDHGIHQMVVVDKAMQDKIVFVNY